MTIKIVQPKTEQDIELLKEFIGKVVNGKTEKNKVKKARLSELIMAEICKDPKEDIRKYLWNLHSKLFPESQID